MKAIKSKWIFKIKRNNENKPERFKARLVAKGYDQKEGIDYTETFSPVVKHEAIKLLLAIAINEGLKIHHLDISTAFLYGKIDETVYIEAPDWLKEELDEGEVLKLNKGLYGLKQASRLWNETLVSFFHNLGFKQLDAENCIFYSNKLIIAVYVDDMMAISKDEKQLQEFKQNLRNKFKFKDLGVLKYMVGLQIEYLNEDTIRIHQRNYIDNVLKKFNLERSRKQVEIPIQPNHKLTLQLRYEEETLRNKINPKPYRVIIGSLIYLMVNTRPDISYAVNVLSRYMHEPRELHWRYLKALLRYIKTTKDYGLIYKRTENPELIGYSDADYGGSLDDRKSTSGYGFKYGDCLISWNSSKTKSSITVINRV